MKQPNRIESGFCIRCGGALIKVPGGIPMCSACQKSTLKQVARMKARKAKKKKKGKG